MRSIRKASRSLPVVKRLIFASFVMLLSFIVLEVVLRLSGWVFLGIQELRNQRSLARGTYTILALGESTTGLGGSNSWPSQLEGILNEQVPDIRFSVINKGIPGITTAGILARLDDTLVQYQPNMVITMVGINDAGAPTPYNRGFEQTGIYQQESWRSLRTLRIVRFAHVLWSLVRETFTIKDEDTPQTYVSPGASGVWERIELGQWHIDQEDIEEGEAVLREVIRTHPENVWGYIELANLLRNTGRLSEAKSLYQTALMIEEKVEALVELADVYEKIGEEKSAQETLAHARSIDPKLTVSFGTQYHHPGRYRDQKAQLQEEVEQNPESDGPLILIANFYRNRGRTREAIAVFEQAIEKNPGNEGSVIELARLYRDIGEVETAESLLQKALVLAPSSDIAYRELANLNRSLGRSEEANVFDERADALNPTPLATYRQIRDRVRAKSILFVAVQYPMRSPASLRDILGPDNPVVDNEAVFREAVAHTTYADYFVDSFAGDFGHATPRGNRLLAENIADTVLKTLRISSR